MINSDVSMFVKPVNIQTQAARLLLDPQPAEINIETQKGGAEIKSDPIKVSIDNRGFFDSIGLKSIQAQAEDVKQRGMEAVSESMRRYAQAGKILSMPRNKNAIAEIALQQTSKSIDSMLIFIPSEKPELYWSGGTVDINYTPDKVNINWEIHQNVDMQYEPYSIEYSQ